MMERHVRVQQVWDWLPAFRAVAETEHLPTASLRTRTSASALSRMVGLLEDDLGVALFERAHRRLQLDGRGRRLLDAVRDAMRLIDDALVDVVGSSHVGPVRVSAAGVAVIPWVVPALASWGAAHPSAELHLMSVAAGDVAAALVQGTLDVAVQSVPVRDERLTQVLLARVPAAVYCGPGHRLYGERDLPLSALSAETFAAPPPGALGGTSDGWPGEVARRVRFHVGRMDAGAALCATGQALAVLPEPAASGLWRLTSEGIAPTPVVAITRRRIRDGAAEGIVAALRAAVSARSWGA